MARELTPAELRELLPAYALDAVDAEERAQVDAYLGRAPDARHEVAALQEVAALLAYTGPDAAPDDLWGRIEGALGAEPPRLVFPLAPLNGSGRARRSRGLAAKVAIGVAAASAVAAGVTAVVVSDEMSRQEERLDQVAASVTRDGMRRAAEVAAADPRARSVRLEGSDRASATVIAMPNGRAFLMGHGIRRLGPGRTYQLWAMTGDLTDPTMVPAGILGRSVDVAAFHVPEGSRGFMVTEEAAPGTSRSDAAPVVEGHFA